MRIATCLTADGTIGTPFEANSICVFERSPDGWERILTFEYFPVPDMGVDHARALLRGIASLIRDCEIFLLGELRGYAHVWLSELGFRAWKSEGDLFEQLEKVAEQDLLDENRQAFAEPGMKGTIRGSGASGCCEGGCGGRPAKECGDGCGGHSPNGHTDSGYIGEVPSPFPVGDPKDKRYRFDLERALEENPSLNSRFLLLPFLEKKDFRALELHLDHVPRWFGRTLEELELEVSYAENAPGERGIDATVTAKE